MDCPVWAIQRGSTHFAEGQYQLCRGAVSTLQRGSTYFLQGLSPQRGCSKGTLSPKSSHKYYFSTIHPLADKGQTPLSIGNRLFYLDGFKTGCAVRILPLKVVTSLESAKRHLAALRFDSQMSLPLTMNEIFHSIIHRFWAQVASEKTGD
jgi:hypothetical protein